MSLSSKLNAWIRSPQGQARLQEKMAEYTRDGVEKTAAGDSIVPEKRGWEAAAKFIQVLQMTAKSYDLPESVMKHIDEMDSGSIIVLETASRFLYILAATYIVILLRTTLRVMAESTTLWLCLITDTTHPTMYMVGGMVTHHLERRLAVRCTTKTLHGCAAKKSVRRSSLSSRQSAISTGTMVLTTM